MAIRIRILPLLFLAVSCLPASAADDRTVTGPENHICRQGETVRVGPARLRLAATFQGRAAIVVTGPCRVEVRELTIHGNRERLQQRQPLPPYDRRFADHYQANGLLVIGASSVSVERSEFREIAGFAILISGAKQASISGSRFEDSGSRNVIGRNNTTGGVLFEDGSADFVVEQCHFVRILGNAVWTHSRYKSQRNGPGRFTDNDFEEIGRDAVQVGHASRVEVRGNRMRRIGYPAEAVDVEGGGTPVGIDTAGNVDLSIYASNRMEDIAGKCIDLDGFHHGDVVENVCRGAENFGIVMNNTNPDMQSVGIRIERNHLSNIRFGAIFLIGSGHTVMGNRMEGLNCSRCSELTQPGCAYLADEPDMLRSGIYLGRRAERPAVTRGNVISGNRIGGWRMDKHCVGYAPGVSRTENRVAANECVAEGK